MDNTRSGSEVALIRGPSSTTSVNLGVNGDNTTSSNSSFDFDRLMTLPHIAKTSNWSRAGFL